MPYSYAYDENLFGGKKRPDLEILTINEDLVDLMGWCLQTKVTINLSKTYACILYIVKEDIKNRFEMLKAIYVRT